MIKANRRRDFNSAVKTIRCNGPDSPSRQQSLDSGVLATAERFQEFFGDPISLNVLVDFVLVLAVVAKSIEHLGKRQVG